MPARIVRFKGDGDRDCFVVLHPTRGFLAAGEDEAEIRRRYPDAVSGGAVRVSASTVDQVLTTKTPAGPTPRERAVSPLARGAGSLRGR